MPESLRELAGAFRSGLLGVAFAGALAAETFWPANNRWRAVCNVLTGTAISCYTAPLFVHLIVTQWPSLQVANGPIAGALYFWLGLLGMQLVPGVHALALRVMARKGGE